MSFIIENGVLLRYNGDEKEVAIPDGVTKIGDMAFFCAKIEKIFLNALCFVTPLSRPLCYPTGAIWFVKEKTS